MANAIFTDHISQICLILLAFEDGLEEGARAWEWVSPTYRCSWRLVLGLGIPYQHLLLSLDLLEVWDGHGSSVPNGVS